MNGLTPWWTFPYRQTVVPPIWPEIPKNQPGFKITTIYLKNEKYPWKTSWVTPIASHAWSASVPLSTNYSKPVLKINRSRSLSLLSRDPTDWNICLWRYTNRHYWRKALQWWLISIGAYIHLLRLAQEIPYGNQKFIGPCCKKPFIDMASAWPLAKTMGLHLWKLRLAELLKIKWKLPTAHRQQTL